MVSLTSCQVVSFSLNDPSGGAGELVYETCLAWSLPPPWSNYFSNARVCWRKLPPSSPKHHSSLPLSCLAYSLSVFLVHGCLSDILTLVNGLTANGWHFPITEDVYWVENISLSFVFSHQSVSNWSGRSFLPVIMWDSNGLAVPQMFWILPSGWLNGNLLCMRVMEGDRSSWPTLGNHCQQQAHNWQVRTSKTVVRTQKWLKV